MPRNGSRTRKRRSPAQKEALRKVQEANLAVQKNKSQPQKESNKENMSPWSPCTDAERKRNRNKKSGNCKPLSLSKQLDLLSAEIKQNMQELERYGHAMRAIENSLEQYEEKLDHIHEQMICDELAKARRWSQRYYKAKKPLWYSIAWLETIELPKAQRAIATAIESASKVTVETPGSESDAAESARAIAECSLRRDIVQLELGLARKRMYKLKTRYIRGWWSYR